MFTVKDDAAIGSTKLLGPASNGVAIEFKWNGLFTFTNTVTWDAAKKLITFKVNSSTPANDILALVARRQSLAQRIGQIKRDAGIPTRDYRQERDVVERARASAVQHGLTPQLGEDLILTLIR